MFIFQDYLLNLQFKKEEVYEKAAEEMNFTDAEDLLEFFFEYGTDETALEQLVDDAYDGQDMKDY